MAPPKNEMWWGNLSGIPVQFEKRGGGGTFLVALFITGVTHLLAGSSLYKGPNVLTTAGQELLRVFRVELF